ncbi:AMP-binding protein [Actinokineospora auranticolor]|uniref:Acyl-CoA synthetase (AMP-forming)/AMP-acid ligase II n=1 Tax=Actinokineospora auranticolor TaxID=155976 RepID=A0A2S6GT34_9PSEU|nr:AMP-binding protein [Actinokineospora auranticolor]PPK68418.1 acyl-CoA synthetase (AMP-forming)/AMP-acid ligase II [Actinokineospora auranticolor]
MPTHADPPPAHRGPSPTALRILARARSRPDATALVWRGTGISYRELGDRASRAAGRLAEPPGYGPVAVVAEKSPDTIALLLALLAAGRPFLLPSPTLAEPVLRRLTDAAGCVATLSTVEYAGPAAAPATGPPQDGVTFMLTTSGSTGVPKVVPLRGSAVDRFTTWAAARFEIGPRTTVLSYAPLEFDLSLLDVWATLVAGGTVVLVERERATAAGYLADLLRHVDVVQAVPMLYHLLAEHGGIADLPARHVIATGDTLPDRTLAALPELFPRARLYNLYGCTETNDSFLHELDPRARPVPLGTPVDGVRSVLVDADGGLVTGPGVGELLVHTPFQTDGYLDPELTAAKFTELGDGSRYFRSGDLVRRHPGGALTLEGRTDFQVKVRGVRVNAQAVERALLEHDDVTEAVVLAVPHPVAGNTLHAVVRAHGVDSLTLRRHCAARLALAAVPSAFTFADEPLPRTGTGKPDRGRIARDHVNAVVK